MVTTSNQPRNTRITKSSNSDSDFNNLSRGNQYLRLLRIEYQDLLKYARYTASVLREALSKYEYAANEKSAQHEDLRMAEQDIAHYTAILKGIGAENEEYLTVRKRAESPQFTDITCTTV